MSGRTEQVASVYDLMASTYDRVYDAELEGRTTEAIILATVLDTHQPHARSLLDLGAGTGMILKHLAQITPIETFVGVEQSPAMIREAERNLPEATFVEGDIRDFEVDRTVDVVTCLFDTMNHLPEGNDWEKVFERAQAHLNPGGIFVFDMLTPYFLKDEIQHGGQSWQFEGGRYHVYIRPKPGTDHQLSANITITQPGQAEPTKFEIVETMFDPRLVINSLKKYLRPVRAFDHGKARKFDSLTLPEVTPSTYRIMTVAQKPLDA